MRIVTALSRSFLVGACLAAMAACTQPQALTDRPAFFSASVETLDFGDVGVGQSEERVVTIINKGDKPLKLEEPTGDTLKGIFTLVLPSNLVEGGKDVVARITFEPQDIGELVTTFSFPNDSANAPRFVLNVVGSGVEPDPCDGVNCNNVSPYCLDADNSRTFAPGGQCVDGLCNNTPIDQPCVFGCDQATGLCEGDPCQGVSCNEPPNDQCFAPQGSCLNGGCVFQTVEGSCNDEDPCTVNDACDNGLCRGDLIDCRDQAPVPQCTGPFHLANYDIGNSFCSPVSASSFQCTTPQLADVYCANGCETVMGRGQCAGDPCAGDPCDDGENCTVDTCTPSGGGGFSCDYALLAPGGTPASCDPAGACNSGTCIINGSGSGPFAVCTPNVGDTCQGAEWDPENVPAFCTQENNVPGICAQDGDCDADPAWVTTQTAALCGSPCPGIACLPCPSLGTCTVIDP